MPTAGPIADSGTPRERHLVLAEDQFYWACLEHAAAGGRAMAAGLTRRRPARRALEFQFEELLPVPVDSIACALIHRPGFSVACGIGRERVGSLATPATRTLRPASVPAWLVDGSRSSLVKGTDAQRLNILAGRDEPTAVRRARRRLCLGLAAALAILAATLMVGVNRRIGEHRVRIASCQARSNAAFARVLATSNGGQPPAVRLASELRALERVTMHPDQPDRGRPLVPSGNRFDAPITLALLLARLPDIPLLTDSLDIVPNRATLVAVVPTAHDAQLLSAAWEAPQSPSFPWRLRQPQVVAERDGAGQTSFRVTLTLDPVPEAAPHGSGTHPSVSRALEDRP